VTDSSAQHPRRCPICGAEKLPESTMCRPCYQRLRRETVTLECAQCKTPFQRVRYQHDRAVKRGNTDTYCSRTCSNAHHAVKHAPICQWCGNGMPGNRGRKYCSPACQKAARPLRAMPERGCHCCGLVFQPKTTRQQFCSNQCADTMHAARMRGAGNPHYKTGTSYAKWFTEMRPLILERDRHQCVVCKVAEVLRPITWRGQTVQRSNLVIHHINEDVTDNTPQNLVALCKTCHARHHKSKTTPWPWFDVYAKAASQSMTSRWRAVTTSLQTAYSSTTV
jgi:hypothetical protein